MSLRAVSPIDTRGLVPMQPATCAPICEHVDPRTLFVDPAYQRSLSERSISQIRRIVEGFDWKRFKPPICAFSSGSDGSTILKVIDGQHTAIAAASNPHIATIPVMIVDAPEVEDQASAFIGQNLDRVGITKQQLHVAAVAAGDAAALEMERVCKAAGVKILRSPPAGNVGYGEGETVAFACIATLIKKEGELHAGQVLRICAAAKLSPVKADHIKAIDHLVTEPEFASIDLDALAGCIAGYPSAGIDAKTFAATHSLPIWKAFAAVWFKKAKKRRVATPPPHVLGATIATPGDELETDPRGARGGWDQGNHIRRCVKCDNRFRGGRRAIECAPCAYEDAAKAGESSNG